MSLQEDDMGKEGSGRAGRQREQPVQGHRIMASSGK